MDTSLLSALRLKFESEYFLRNMTIDEATTIRYLAFGAYWGRMYEWSDSIQGEIRGEMTSLERITLNIDHWEHQGATYEVVEGCHRCATTTGSLADRKSWCIHMKWRYEDYGMFRESMNDEAVFPPKHKLFFGSVGAPMRFGSY